MGSRIRFIYSFCHSKDIYWVPKCYIIPGTGNTIVILPSRTFHIHDCLGAGKTFYFLNFSLLICTRLMTVGRINRGSVYKAPNIVTSALQKSVIFIIGQKSEACHISTTNLIACECDLLVEITLTCYVFQFNLSITYNTVMTLWQWEILLLSS